MLCRWSERFFEIHCDGKNVSIFACLAQQHFSLNLSRSNTSFCVTVTTKLRPAKVPPYLTLSYFPLITLRCIKSFCNCDQYILYCILFFSSMPPLVTCSMQANLSSALPTKFNHAVKPARFAHALLPPNQAPLPKVPTHLRRMFSKAVICASQSPCNCFFDSLFHSEHFDRAFRCDGEGQQVRMRHTSHITRHTSHVTHHNFQKPPFKRRAIICPSQV